ncbi:hypothetical protein GH714_008224 [Hevea brasiliensis]|uniref:Receptor ligand binding region domain-containing protein n=1 Tax=Hevea brasiliensis TaxID=3981 RepID=A0A6A6M0G9_HEVBR|nr:hypothetical protein GH714_008224 [Hevea brasiliensis]
MEKKISAVESELNIYGLWAYDAATILAIAIEKAGIANFGFQKTNVSSNSTDISALGFSRNGENLIEALSNTRVTGLTGDIHFVNGQLPSSAFQIVNDCQGYCIDVFEAVVKALPYALPYEYIPFAKPDGGSAGTYDDMVYQLYLGSFDAVVGDTL